MVEWPQEKRVKAGRAPQAVRRLESVPVALLQEVRNTPAFGVLVQYISDANREKASAPEKASQLAKFANEAEGLKDYDLFLRELIPALAAVEFFRGRPTRESWEYVHSLAWNSALIETYLPQAVVLAARDLPFRASFLHVARDVVEEAARDPGRRAIERERSVGAELRDYWQKHRCLSDLWRGRFDRSWHTVGRDDDYVLSIAAEIDIAEYIRLLDFFDYPDAVANSLVRCGAAWQFSRWRALALAAPPAFSLQTEWNGSLILPLLLSIARDQFQFPLGQKPEAAQVIEATDEIRELATEIAEVLASRVDALGCSVRWGNWLLRSGIPAVSMNAVPHPTDAASRGFIEDALMDALIARLPVGAWRLEAAPDAEPWEAWCHLAAGVLVSYGDKTRMPPSVWFLDEWNFTADEWSDARGQQLRSHAEPFSATMQRADAYGARILALLLIEDPKIISIWKTFWGRTFTLREIVEYGDAEEKDGNWEGRMQAGRLLMLQFSIGLMLMDALVMPPRALAYDRFEAVRELLPFLNEAVCEMQAIDQLNQKFWSEALRHLAIRRVKYLSAHDQNGCVLFPENSRPSFSDFIQHLAGDTENLLALAYVARLNGVDARSIATAFRQAGVDLSKEISLAARLLELSSRAINLTQEQVDATREILVETN